MDITSRSVASYQADKLSPISSVSPPSQDFLHATPSFADEFAVKLIIEEHSVGVSLTHSTVRPFAHVAYTGNAGVSEAAHQPLLNHANLCVFGPRCK
jgi:hypothetical protein